ncbi:MAG: tetratricopeptide repeat protein [Rhizomicrobium sp.]
MRIRALLLTAAAAMMLGSQAQAAITVLGASLAHNCYQAAEFGGDPKTGIATCNYALDGAMPTSDRAATYINRGILKSRNSDPDGALDDYNHGLSLNASLGEGYVDRGATMIVLKRYQDALNDIDKGISMGSKKPEIAYYDRAIVDEALGDIRGAYLDYRKAVEISPGFTLASEQLTRFRVIKKPANGT